MRTGKLITRLDRYMFRQLAFALIAVTGGLAALDLAGSVVALCRVVVNHGLSFVVFVQFTGLLIPSFVAVILPITTFVVVQFIYQRLAGDREITVMRAAGLSPLALSRPALRCGSGHRLRGYALNLWSSPQALRRSASSNGRFATGWPPSCCRRASLPRFRQSHGLCALHAMLTAPCAVSWSTTGVTRPRMPRSWLRRGRLLEGPAVLAFC